MIDYAITFALAYILGFFLHFGLVELLFFYQPIIWFAYSVIMDATTGKTAGKYIMGLKAVSFIGKLGVVKAIGRNLTKLNWIAFVADIIAGLSTEGEPRQRLTERFLDSLVVSERRPKKQKAPKPSKTKEKKKVDAAEELELPD